MGERPSTPSTPSTSTLNPLVDLLGCPSGQPHCLASMVEDEQEGCGEDGFNSIDCACCRCGIPPQTLAGTRLSGELDRSGVSEAMTLPPVHSCRQSRDKPHARTTGSRSCYNLLCWDQPSAATDQPRLLHAHSLQPPSVGFDASTSCHLLCGFDGRPSIQNRSSIRIDGRQTLCRKVHYSEAIPILTSCKEEACRTCAREAAPLAPALRRTCTACAGLHRLHTLAPDAATFLHQTASSRQSPRERHFGPWA